MLLRVKYNVGDVVQCNNSDKLIPKHATLGVESQPMHVCLQRASVWLVYLYNALLSLREGAHCNQMGFLSDRFSVTIVSQAINGSSAGNVLTHRLRVMCLCQHYHSFDMSRWGENPETLKYLFWQIIYQVIVCCRNLKRWRMVRLRLRVVTVGNLPTSMATKLKQGNKTNYQGKKIRARQQNQLARD